MEAVTRGIKVTASVVLLPDNPMTRTRNLHEYAYSIRFMLLPAGEQLALAPGSQPLASAQLLSRHWVILDDCGQCTDTVEGEAVIGKYPHLTPGAAGNLSSSCSDHLYLPACHAGPGLRRWMMHRQYVATVPGAQWLCN